MIGRCEQCGSGYRVLLAIPAVNCGVIAVCDDCRRLTIERDPWQKRGDLLVHKRGEVARRDERIIKRLTGEA